MTQPQRNDPQPLHTGQIILALVGMTGIFGQTTLLLLKYTHWHEDNWWTVAGKLGFIIGFICSSLSSNRRLFKSAQPVRTDPAAVLRRNGSRPASRVAALAALAFAFGACLGSNQLPPLALTVTGAWFSLIVWSGVGMWLTRHGTPAPADHAAARSELGPCAVISRE